MKRTLVILLALGFVFSIGTASAGEPALLDTIEVEAIDVGGTDTGIAPTGLRVSGDFAFSMS